MYNKTYIRDIDRSYIEKYCEEYDLNPRIDSTNLESIYTRNKIRLDLIPYMKENFNENIVESIARMGNNLKFDNDYIEQEALAKFNEVAKLNTDSVEIALEQYSKMHVSIKSRIIRNAIKYILGDTNFVYQKHIEERFELKMIIK